MLRIIAGVVVGFLVWFVLLIVSDSVWAKLSPDWYRTHQLALSEAVTNKTPFLADSMILLVAVIRSAFLSILAGLTAGLIAGERFRAAILLGVLLLAFGVFIHLQILNNVPFWYHGLILLPLIPLTLFGGKLSGRQKTESI